MAEGQTAGGRAAVQLHLVHHGQHGGDQNGNVGNVHGDQVLGQAGNDGDRAQQSQLLAADDPGELLGEDLSKAGGGNGGGKGTQQHIGQSGGGVSGESAGERTHNGGNIHVTHQTANHAGNQHGQQHIQLQQAEHTQDDYGYGYRI